MNCKHCGQAIPDAERSSRDFCDDVCRTEYHNKRRKIDRKLDTIKKHLDELYSVEFWSPDEKQYIKEGVEKRQIATQQAPKNAYEWANHAYTGMRVLVGIATTSKDRHEVSEATYALKSLRRKLDNLDDLLKS